MALAMAAGGGELEASAIDFVLRRAIAMPVAETKINRTALR